MTSDRLRAEATILAALLKDDPRLDGLTVSDLQVPIVREIVSLRASRGKVNLDMVHEYLTARYLREITEMLDRAGENVEGALEELKRDRRYELRTLQDVFQYEQPTYLIDPILIEGTVSLLGAYTGSGKTIASLSIIKSILTGEPLWRKYPVLRTGPVLLIDEETPQGFLRERIERMGFTMDLPLYFLHFQAVRLDQEDCFNSLMDKIEDVKPVLVTIDSLIRVHRQKEDDAIQMASVVNRLRKIANSGPTVLVIHHHKKGEGPLSQKLRGSSDIPGGVDIEYALVRKDEYLEFSSVKTRTQPLEPIRLKMEISKKEIEVIYCGTEVEEILGEVKDLLSEQGPTGIGEIAKGLEDRGIEIGINKLRDLLKRAIDREIGGGQQNTKGKPWLFWPLDSSRGGP